MEGEELAPFVLGEGKSWYWSIFRFHGQEYRIEVYDDIVVMHQGEDRYFECYQTEEFSSDSSLIDGFVGRLESYLRGEPWEGHDEDGRLVKLAKGVMRRFGRSRP